MELTAGLNPQQQQALTAGLGPVMALAGPGSGKTRVLTQRIAYLISMMGVQPYHILAVTFTNKAAREMRGRVEDLLGDRMRGLTLGTFHAVCARILRIESQLLPFDKNFVIFDSDDQRSLVKRAIKDLNLDEKRYRPQSVHGSISRAKNELIWAEDYPLNTYRDEVVARVYESYQKLLLASNALDFDDLLLWTAHLLETEPEMRQKYARRYEHVLVDEFQDTNVAQYNLIKHLTSHHGNVFVVGDADQSIYRWRGADYRNMLRFRDDFPDAQVILLEQNYRSTQYILDAAMGVIERNPQRTHKALFTERGAGRKIILHELFNGGEEAEYVVGAIARGVAQDNTQPGDYAIMYRTNAQSRLLEEAFLRAGLPYKLVGAQRFYGRREVKDIIAYLRLMQNPSDEASLTRVINVPPRKIGNKTYAALRTRATQENLSPSEVLLDLVQGDESSHWESFTGRAVKALAPFANKFKRWQEDQAALTPLQLMDRILEDIDYQTHLDDGTEEGLQRWENVLELRRLAAEFDERGLTAFLEEVALVSDQDTLDDSANVPTLLTLHAAKGLEFSRVFIVGLEDGTLPHSRSFDDPEAMAEERRLLYVGITRAKDLLTLTYAMNRSTFGYSEPSDPSRFLVDLPPGALDGHAPVQVLHRPSGATHRKEEWDAPSPAPAAAAILQPKFHPSMRVCHPSWGEGMVLNSNIQDGEEIVDVYFEGEGLKRVAASFAKLEIIGE